MAKSNKFCSQWMTSHQLVGVLMKSLEKLKAKMNLVKEGSGYFAVDGNLLSETILP